MKGTNRGARNYATKRVRSMTIEAVGVAQELEMGDTWINTKSGNPVEIQTVDRRKLEVRILNHKFGRSSLLKIKSFMRAYKKEDVK